MRSTVSKLIIASRNARERCNVLNQNWILLDDLFRHLCGNTFIAECVDFHLRGNNPIAHETHTFSSIAGLDVAFFGTVDDVMLCHR